jgi:6-phosphogluconolactonase
VFLHRWDADVGAEFLVAQDPNSQAWRPTDVEIPTNYARVYLGTYTNRGSRGIYQGVLDLRTGELSLEGLAAGTERPTFLAIHPTEKYLYAVGEVSDFDDQPTGVVHAFRIDAKTGQLTRINRQPSGGMGPCHVSVDASGRCVLVANYRGGSVAALRIREDGGLEPAATVIQHHGSSVHPKRQEGPHAHSINPDPTNRFALAADLGLDRVLLYRLDPNAASLKPASTPFVTLPPGSGPRHLAFHPDGKSCFVINELLSTLAVFQYDATTGTLTARQTVSTLPAEFAGQNTTAEVQVHPSGRFVYGSNRGHDSIAVFAIASETGEVSLVEHESTAGESPRNFRIDPSGRFLLAANQNSDNVVVFRIDPQDGSLAPTGSQIGVSAPVCIRFAAMPGP